MHKMLAVFSLLLLASLAMGQTFNSAAASQQALTPQMGGPVFVAPIISFPPQAGGLLLQSGYATTIGWGYPPVLITPTASFSTISSSPVGATNATSNLQAGAANSTLNSLEVPLPAVQTAIEVTQPGAVLPMGIVPPGFVGQPAAPVAMAFSAGAAVFDVVSARGFHERRSLGEAVKEMRAQPRTPAVRTLTNTDVQRLKDQPLSAPKAPQQR